MVSAMEKAYIGGPIVGSWECQSEKQPEVPRALDRLNATLNELEAELAVLADRLMPVCSGGGKENADAPTPLVGCPLADGIESANRRIQRLHVACLSINGRLEL